MEEGRLYYRWMEVDCIVDAGSFSCDEVVNSCARRLWRCSCELRSQSNNRLFTATGVLGRLADRWSGIMPRSRMPALAPKRVTPAKFDLQRSSSAHKPLNIEDTRETPTTTPGHTNGTVKMVRGRSRFLDDARRLHCGKRRNGMAGAMGRGRCPRQSQICRRSVSNS